MDKRGRLLTQVEAESLQFIVISELIAEELQGDVTQQDIEEKVQQLLRDPNGKVSDNLWTCAYNI